MGNKKAVTYRMPPGQALQILDQAVAVMQLSRIQHVQIQEAIKILDDFIKVNTEIKEE